MGSQLCHSGWSTVAIRRHDHNMLSLWSSWDNRPVPPHLLSHLFLCDSSLVHYTGVPSVCWIGAFLTSMTLPMLFYFLQNFSLCSLKNWLLHLYVSTLMCQPWTMSLLRCLLIPSSPTPIFYIIPPYLLHCPCHKSCFFVLFCFCHWPNLYIPWG